MSPDVKQFPVKSVQRRLLIPLICVLLLLVGGGSASLLVNQQRNMKYASQNLLEDVSRSFEISLMQDAKILTALEDSLLQDTHLHDALQAKDRNQLLDLFEITFQNFRKKYSVTHFYFHNPDRVNLLRVHKPEKYGDLIDRFTLHEAENSGKTAWGIELGPLGTFTLRVVQPVYKGDTLIGYLELGQEIEEELQRLQQGFNVELAMTINKDALEQLSWETGMEMLGRESNWNRYQEKVLIYYTQSNFLSKLDRFIQSGKESRQNHLAKELQFDNKSWQLIAHPLKDASGSDVGDLFILRDISPIKAKFTRFAAMTVTFALLLLITILTYYYRILRKTDQEISHQQKNLRKSKAKFQGLVESSSGWSWELTTDGNYSYASPQVEVVLGYKPEEVIGKPLFDMMPQEEADRVTEIFKELLEAAKPIVQLERVVLHKNGQHLVLETYGVPIFDETGKVTGYLGMDRDITARKQIDEQRHLYEHIISATQDLMSFIDEQYVYQSVNDSYCRYHNLKKEDIVGKSVAELMGAEVFAQVVKEPLDDALGGKLVHYEAWFDYPNMGRRYMDVTYNPFFDINQVIKGVVVVVGDHTERKKVENKLHLKEQFQEKLLNDMLTFVAVLNPNGEVIFVNNTPLEMAGLELKDVRGKKFFDVTWWRHSDEVQNMIKRDIEKCASGESLVHDVQIQIADGSLMWIEYSMHPIFDEHGVVQYLVPEGRDITGRKKAEESGKKAALEWSTAMDASEDAIYLLDPSRHLIQANKVFYLMTGSTPQTAIGQHIESIVHPEGEESPCPVCLAQEEKRDEIIIMEPDHPDNPAGRPIEISVKVVRGENGQPISILMKLHDLAKQRKTENALRKSTEEWQKTFNAMTDIVTIQDKDMHIVRANKAAHDFFEIDDGDLVGKHCYEVFSGITEPCPGCPELKTLETIHSHSETIEHKKLGKIFYVTSAPILGENNEIEFLVHIAKDITEQKRLEEELFQAHKMEAIGTLAGGIAHDFNNILSAIIGFSKVAKQDLPEGSSAVNDIDEVISSSYRAADLVQQILTFSRKSEHDLQSFNPHLIVKEVLRMLGSSLPSTVIIHEDIDKRCGKILADPTNIHQILMNLCTNALHAMKKETGTLTVKLYRMEITAEEIVHETGVAAGPFVVLSVNDTGYGMDEATKERIFEPYFTTKEMGKGTGMGLAVIHGIIQDYKGFVRVDSALGKGSTFSVYLPALQEETSRSEGSAPKEAETKTILPTGNERILVVDDEPLLVKINEKQLEKCGYTVTGTTDSRDALEKIRTQPEQFDLLITDQTMPGLSGVELAEEVQKIRPGLPIILCTGHSDVVSREDALAMGIKKYVTKPIYEDELFLAIREVLDEK